MSGEAESSPAMKNRSIEPDSRSIRCRMSIKADRSRPRTHRCTRGASRTPCVAGSKSRTNAAGRGPMTAINDSIDCSTLATRPNARPAAQKPTTSRSSGAE